MLKRMGAVVALVAILHWFGGTAEGLPEEQGGPVRTEMRNVTYHFTDGVSVRIVSLTGALEPTEAGHWPIFDKGASFNIHVDSSKILVLPSDLAGVLNTYVFNAKDSPLKDISIGIEKGRLKIKGKLRKGDVAFETSSSLSANSDGRVRLHTEKVRAVHVPVKGLMDLFGIDMADLIKNGKVPGLESEKDDLLLKLQDVLPPPRIQGPVTDIRIESGSIVLAIGKEKAEAPSGTGNFMSFKGNQLQFGKLLMNDADLTILDLDPNDPLDFFLERYKDQLVPGYSKITPSFGLRAYMKDFGKLGSKAAARSR